MRVLCFFFFFSLSPPFFFFKLSPWYLISSHDELVRASYTKMLFFPLSKTFTFENANTQRYFWADMRRKKKKTGERRSRCKREEYLRNSDGDSNTKTAHMAIHACTHNSEASQVPSEAHGALRVCAPGNQGCGFKKKKKASKKKKEEKAGLHHNFQAIGQPIFFF